MAAGGTPEMSRLCRYSRIDGRDNDMHAMHINELGRFPSSSGSSAQGKQGYGSSEFSTNVFIVFSA